MGNVFVSTATQHGGQETTITSFHTTLLHHGMIIVSLTIFRADFCHMKRSSPYGASQCRPGVPEPSQ